MNRLQRLPRLLSALTLGLVLATGPALAARVTDPDVGLSLADSGPVAVSWTTPADFTEIRYSRNRFEAVRGDWVRDLARHVADRAGRALRPGERLEVRITDIDRAGDYEPSGYRLGDVRVVRDLYPPRIELQFTWRNASGTVLAEGTRRLADPGFLTSSVGMARRNDALQHEKRLIDGWVRDELRHPAR